MPREHPHLSEKGPWHEYPLGILHPNREHRQTGRGDRRGIEIPGPCRGHGPAGRCKTTIQMDAADAANPPISPGRPGLLSKSFRRWWQKRYFQPEDDLLPPAFPDVSEFHHVCIGGPKWAYTAYPVARYLKEIKGLENRNVSAFATFGGPPLKVMELDLIFTPMGYQIGHAGGRMA